MLKALGFSKKSISAAKPPLPKAAPDLPEYAAAFDCKMVKVTSVECSAIRAGKTLEVGQYQLPGSGVRYASYTGCNVLERTAYPTHSSHTQRITFDRATYSALEYRLVLSQEEIEAKNAKQKNLAQEQYLRKKENKDPLLEKVSSQVLDAIQKNKGDWEHLDRVRDERFQTQIDSQSFPDAPMASCAYARLVTHKNEDFPRGALIVAGGTSYLMNGVFDGHGGSWFSSHTSQQMPESIKKHITTFSSFLTPQAARFNGCKHAFVDANGLLKNNRPPGDQSGSTGCVALMHGNMLTVANAGDSRAIVIHENGTLTQVSEDATAEDPRYQRSVTKRQGQVLAGKGNVLRVCGHTIPARGFGDTSWAGISARPKLTEQELKDGDIVVITSDGIWEFTYPDTVAEAVRIFRSKGYTAKQMSQGIVNLAYEVHSRLVKECSKHKKNTSVDDRDDLCAMVMIKKPSTQQASA